MPWGVSACSVPVYLGHACTNRDTLTIQGVLTHPRPPAENAHTTDKLRLLEVVTLDGPVCGSLWWPRVGVSRLVGKASLKTKPHDQFGP